MAQFIFPRQTSMKRKSERSKKFLAGFNITTLTFALLKCSQYSTEHCPTYVERYSALFSEGEVRGTKTPSTSALYEYRAYAKSSLPGLAPIDYFRLDPKTKF